MIDNAYTSDLIVPINYTLVLKQAKTIGIFALSIRSGSRPLKADVIRNIFIECNLVIQYIYTNNVERLLSMIYKFKIQTYTL